MLFYFRILNKEALRRSQEIYDQVMANRMGDRRKVHQDFRDKLLLLLSDFHQYIKGVQKFDNAETQGQLTSFLLKSVGGEIVDSVKSYVSQNKEHNSEVQLLNSNIIFNITIQLTKKMFSQSLINMINKLKIQLKNYKSR